MISMCVFTRKYRKTPVFIRQLQNKITILGSVKSGFSSIDRRIAQFKAHYHHEVLLTFISHCYLAEAKLKQEVKQKAIRLTLCILFFSDTFVNLMFVITEI